MRRETADLATIGRGHDEEGLPQHWREPKRGGKSRQIVLQGDAGLGRGENLIEVVVHALEQQQHDEPGERRIGQPVECPGLGEPRPSVGVKIWQPNRACQLLGRLCRRRREQPCEKGAVLRFEMAVQLRPDKDVHGLAGEVLDLTGSKAHDTTSVEQNQHSRDRCE